MNKLVEWSLELAYIPAWLYGECYDAVGDLSETITLLLPQHEKQSDIGLKECVEEYLLPLKGLDEEEQKEKILWLWQQFTKEQTFVFNKLIMGNFRIGVSQNLILRALSIVTGNPAPVIAHRLMGHWVPTAESFEQLFSTEVLDADVSKPYPFYLAYALDKNIESLGNPQNWQAEWKWDGIRAQLMNRNGEVYIWSRGEELVTHRFPEIEMAGKLLPEGTVLDGEILPWKDNRVLPFSFLQKRLGRKDVSKKLMADIPVVFLCYDILEMGGTDIRTQPLKFRRKEMDSLLNEGKAGVIKVSETLKFKSWEELAIQREESRSRGVEGLMLKKLDSPYLAGRKKGDWWKWKIAPMTIDAVLIYAARGSGRRASLYTDYTFGIWHEGRLHSFAKAYSGLTDEEIRKVDAFVRNNTLDKFGPVRTVTPKLVFELAFENIQRSTRHKIGIAVRFPRILRWRTDKTPEQADTLQDILNMLTE